MPPSVRRKRRDDKPCKPYPDFPLTANGNGQWSKKIRRRVYYFGPWSDPDGALNRYLEVKDDLQAGRKPRPRDGFRIRDLCNNFLAAKKGQLDAEEITLRTFSDYHQVCGRIVEFFGRNRPVDDLDPEDFRQLRDKLAETMGPVTRHNQIGRIRVVFNYAFANGHIDRPVRFGAKFRRPPKRVLRQERQKKPARMFEAEEIRRMLEAADGQVRAMLLLAINGGLGNSDCAGLPRSALDLDAAWLDFPRPKTAIPRRFPLWPETVKALRRALDKRPEPKDSQDKELVFVTKYGQRWVRVRESRRTLGRMVCFDSIVQEIRKLLRQLGLKGGRNFYALRHSFETVSEDTKDRIAVDYIMGHARDDMASVHRERISDERLKAVTDYVRRWLFGTDEGGQNMDYEVTGRDKPAPK